MHAYSGCICTCIHTAKGGGVTLMCAQGDSNAVLSTDHVLQYFWAPTRPSCLSLGAVVCTGPHVLQCNGACTQTLRRCQESVSQLAASAPNHSRLLPALHGVRARLLGRPSEPAIRCDLVGKVGVPAPALGPAAREAAAPAAAPLLCPRLRSLPCTSSTAAESHACTVSMQVGTCATTSAAPASAMQRARPAH